MRGIQFHLSPNSTLVPPSRREFLLRESRMVVHSIDSKQKLSKKCIPKRSLGTRKNWCPTPPTEPRLRTLFVVEPEFEVILRFPHNNVTYYDSGYAANRQGNSVVFYSPREVMEGVVSTLDRFNKTINQQVGNSFTW